MKEIEIMLTDSEIEPREIRVPAHEPVRLLVINFGHTEHQFAVESEQCSVEIEGLQPGQTRALEHVFTEPGHFRTASHCGESAAHGVNGWLVVEG